MQRLLAGVARSDITPPLGLVHAGWGGLVYQRAVAVDLPLWATALAISDSHETIVIVDLDHVGLPDSAGDRTRSAISEATSLPLSHVRLAYTHTHSGVRAKSIFTDEGARALEIYEQNVSEHVVGVARAALHNLQPARIAAGRGRCHIGVNRRFRRPSYGAVIIGRNWEGPVDPDVEVVRIDTQAGDALGVIVHYACHGTTVGPDNELITPDFPGVAKRVVEEATGATCLFLQGASGDINPCRGFVRDGIQEYRRLGRILGHEASRVWWAMQLPERRERFMGTVESGGPLADYVDEPVEPEAICLRVRTREMHLPLRPFVAAEILDRELHTVICRVQELVEARGDANEIRYQAALGRRLANQLGFARLYQGMSCATLELQGFALGTEIALVATPGEPFVEIGQAVKRASPFIHTLFSGNSNVGHGYIPTPDAFEAGGYEVEYASPFSGHAAEVLTRESCLLLQELATPS